MTLKTKVPPPIVLLIFATLMWLSAQALPQFYLPQAVTLAVISVLVLFGFGLCLSGLISFRLAKTTVNPTKPETSSALVTSGIYRITRNPMYLGFVLFLAAWSIFLASIAALLLVVGFMLYIHHFQIKPEEQALTTLFGEQFNQYKKQVRPWL